MQKIQHDLAPGECCLINRAEEPMVLGWETAMIQLETGTDSLHINPALVERVEFARGLSMDKVFMRDGSVKKGIWFTPELSVRIQGKSQKISASNLKVILFPVVQKEE